MQQIKWAQVQSPKSYSPIARELNRAQTISFSPRKNSKVKRLFHYITKKRTRLARKRSEPGSDVAANMPLDRSSPRTTCTSSSFFSSSIKVAQGLPSLPFSSSLEEFAEFGRNSATAGGKRIDGRAVVWTRAAGRVVAIANWHVSDRLDFTEYGPNNKLKTG